MKRVLQILASAMVIWTTILFTSLINSTSPEPTTKPVQEVVVKKLPKDQRWVCIKRKIYIPSKDGDIFRIIDEKGIIYIIVWHAQGFSCIQPAPIFARLILDQCCRVKLYENSDGIQIHQVFECKEGKDEIKT